MSPVQTICNHDQANTASNQYGIYFASAGHAALIDYPHAKGLQKIGTDVWEQGGIVSAVYARPSIKLTSPSH